MDSYTGHVEMRGEPATRTLPGIAVTKMSVGLMDNNAYLIRCTATGATLLVDAAHDAKRILAEAAAQHARIDTIVTTHRHADHWQALAAVAAATEAVVCAGADDAEALPVPVDRPLTQGDVIDIGASSAAVIALRGHTPGSVALHLIDGGGGHHLFTGDSLFPGGPGKTMSKADFTSLMDDLEERVFAALPDSTWVYPGHGDDTTLGAERPQLPEWRARGW